ncbi:H(+)/Cl(-) exchange transporter 7 [Nymphon striatum]|nr:H(+)/Cl(-) exchange transporter 7 [Nymphon striatum]
MFMYLFLVAFYSLRRRCKFLESKSHLANCGFTGALFNHITINSQFFRMRYITKKWALVLEAVILHCDEGSYNSLAAIWFQTPEAGVRSFFHDNRYRVLLLQPLLQFFCICYFLLSTWTYGVSVPRGYSFQLITGAAWPIIRNYFSILQAWADPGKFALIDSCSTCGVVRMTISLTVILIEATGIITFGLPLMIDTRSFGRFRGLILRSQLVVVSSQTKVFNETSECWTKLTLDDFTDNIQDIQITCCIITKNLQGFRALGIRHMVVVNNRNEVIGIVTRKDLARYRTWHHGYHMA